jgi:outer membrane lipoprotein-sorting protein
MNNIQKSFILISLLSVLLAINYGCVKSDLRVDDSHSRNIYLAAGSKITEAEIISAMAEIDLVTFRGNHKMKAIILLKRPSYLRLEILSPLGIPEYYLVATPEKMNVFIPSKKIYYQGKPEVANLAKFIFLPLSIEDIVLIMSGTFPPINEEQVSYKSYKEADSLIVEAESGKSGSQIIKLRNDLKLSSFIQKDNLGQEEYNVQYGEYSEERGFPLSIVVNLANGITSMNVKYRDAKIEENNDLSIFNLQIPENMETVLLN